MDSLVFDTVVGVVFVFGVFAFAVSGVVEGLARFFGLRAEFLLRGVSSLLDSNTEFKRGWLKKVLDNAQARQSAADAATAEPALKRLEGQISAPAQPQHLDAANKQIKLALEKINAARSKRTEVTSAQAKLDQAPKDPTAQPELDQAKDDLQAALKVAVDAVDAVPALVRQAEVDIDAMAPGTDREEAIQGLAASREIFLAAQRAMEGARGNREGKVTVASVISEPIVDLTAALEVPANFRADRLALNTKRKLPSYMSARTFSRALVNTLVPAPEGGETTVGQLKLAVEGIGDEKLRRVLLGHLDATQATVDHFREVVEKWYDDHMARVSGWYKRHTRWYVLAVAAVLAVVFNVNAVAMAQSFYSDQALRESVVTAAFSAADCNADDSKTTPSECLQDVRDQIDDLRGAGLPIGWGIVPACEVASTACSDLNRVGLTSPTGGIGSDIWQFALMLLGWALIVFSALMGARFWFDVLSKLGTLRSSGPKPDSSA